MDVKIIAVIGAGAMGRGIACAAALGGYRTILEDASSPARAQGLEWIRRSLEEGVARGEVTLQQKDDVLALLSTARSVEEACRDADLVIEAVPEEMEIKIEIFTLLDKFAKPGAIFASSASSLSIADMAAITFCPEKCVGCVSSMLRPRGGFSKLSSRPPPPATPSKLAARWAAAWARKWSS